MVADNVGFLLHKVGSMMERLSDKQLFEKYGIGFSQFKLMYIIHAQPGLTQTEIAGTLGQTEASISRQIGLLLEARLITIEPGERDRKKHHVSLSPRGVSLTDEAYRHLNAYYAPVLGGFSDTEQAAFLQALQGIHSRLDRAIVATSHKPEK